MRELAKKYIALQSAIIKIGGVACEKYPDLFFPDGFVEDTEIERAAIQLCNKCPVQKLCLDYAVSAQEPYGVWGGTTASDR